MVTMVNAQGWGPLLFSGLLLLDDRLPTTWRVRGSGMWKPSAQPLFQPFFSSFNPWRMTICSTAVPTFCRKNYVCAANLMQLWRGLRASEALEDHVGA